MTTNKRRDFLKTALLGTGFCLAGNGLVNFLETTPVHAAVLPQGEGLKRLKAHSDMFRKDVVKVADNVYAAVGYAASVSSMIIGDDGIIIVDTTESLGAAENVLAEFRKITDKPIKAIIYTHGHRDHVGGARIFVEEGSNPAIYARHNLFFGLDTKHVGTKIGPFASLQRRTIRQFGIKWLKPNTERVNIGLGPGERPVKGMGKGYVTPTDRFAGEMMKLTIAGVEMELHDSPGETDDALCVWLPKEKVLLAGDQFYQAFPNLYAIRGTKYRNFGTWADSLDMMTKFPMDVLVGGHTRPIFGHQKAVEALSDYRDAIRYIIAKTAEGMNKGLYIDELPEYVQLPPELADKYYLQEFYGTVAWSAKAYAVGELGWFDGNPTNLFPTPPKEKAERMAKLAGGKAQLAENMLTASSKGDFQWAMELADILFVLGGDTEKAKKVKIIALRALADNQINACARNYYLTYAKELEAGKVNR